jgi:putative MATE family efflux protein
MPPFSKEKTVTIQLSEHFTYKKLFRFTLPSILMMIFMSVYMVVDGLFVSNLAGDIPFKAINLIMPFLMIVSTVGFMLGSGGTAMVANAYGEKDRKRANRYFSLFVYATILSSVVLSVLSITFIEPIAYLLGAREEILSSCVVYALILLLALPFATLQYFFQSFFVAAEKPRLGLGVIVAAGCTNMVLDALLVGLLPPAYKLIGAAIATAFSQLIGGGVPLLYFFFRNSTPFRLGKTRFDPNALLRACFNGSSEFMSNVAMSLVGMLYNLQLLRYAGDDGVAAYGVMMYVGMIFSSIFVGYSIGVAPIVSFHDGAKNHAEKKSLLKKSLTVIAIASGVMCLSALALSSPLSRLFVGYSEALTAMTQRGFSIFSISFLFMGLAIFGSSFFTALNDGLSSAIISFLRTLVFQLGAVLLLPLLFGGIDGIWWSVVVAELMAALLTALFLKAKKKRFDY